MQLVLDGVKEKQHPGRPKSLTDRQLLQLKRFMLSAAIKDDGGRFQV